MAAGEGVHALSIEAELEASLRIALPPLVELTHRSGRTEHLTETAVVSIPAYGDTVTETIAVPLEDGTFEEHSVTASCYVPASTVRQDVVFTVVHDERVEAEVVEREPLGRSRQESLSLGSSVWADSPYRVLSVPGAQPPSRRRSQPAPATGGELGEWFRELGWEWVW